VEEAVGSLVPERDDQGLVTGSDRSLLHSASERLACRAELVRRCGPHSRPLLVLVACEPDGP